MGEKAPGDRGKVDTVTLKKPIVFNGNRISKAVIEIDHINFGLNKKTKALNVKRRTSFSLADIEKFIALLDGEHIVARNHKRKISQFEVRIDCPVNGRFLGKEFIMVFDTDYDKPDQIYTITLYPGW